MQGADLPHSSTTLDPLPAAAQQAVALCTALLPDWKDVQFSDALVEELSGGITNQLLIVTCRKTGRRAVVRRFGADTEVFIDRALELACSVQLNARGFGAKVRATFDNGRIEAFLDGRTLTTADMAHPFLVPRIAGRLAAFHASVVDGIDKSPQLWSTVRTWLDMARKLDFADCPIKAQRWRQLDFFAMEAELAQAQALCDSTHSPVVFCHNDLLSGNILAMGVPAAASLDDLDDAEVQFIDFEYGCYSFRGFDWGNHFNEWAGFECNYAAYPTLEQQEVFLRAYLEAGSVRSVSPEQVGMAIAEANAFALASHVYWGVWSVLQARYSKIDFDYFEYSGQRWCEYYRRKAEVRDIVLRQFPPPVGEPLAPFAPAFPEVPSEEVPIVPPVSTAPVLAGHVGPPSLPM